MSSPLYSTRTDGLPRSDGSPQGYPWVEWGSVRAYINQAWDPENCPHHSLVGLTGSGKSYLAINGILSMCQMDRVLIIDTKGDDKLVSTTGRPVKEIPRNPWYVGMGRKRDEPRQFWYRLVVDDNPSNARVQVHSALKRVYKEGNWVVYIDELTDITDPKAPGLGLAPWVTQIYRKGRSRHVSIVAGTQEPAWVPRIFYSGASFAWIGRIRDRDRQKRLLEIGGMDRSDLPVISALQRRQWLLAADNGEYFARTTVKV